MPVADGGQRRGGLLRNLAHLGLGQVTTTLLTVLLSATMARRLGPADYGVLYLVMSIATFAFVLVDWGQGPLIIREVARHPGRAGELLGSSVALRSVTTFIAGAGAVAVTWFLGHGPHTVLLAAVLIVAWLPQYLGLSFGWVFRANERMDRDAQINVVFKFAMLVGSVVCLALGGHLLELVLTWSLAGTLTLVLAVFFYRKLALPPLTANRATARELLRDGAPIFAVSVAVAVEPYFNANILYKLASPAVVGWYGAAWNIAGTLIAPATIVGAAMYPRLSTSAANPAEFKRIFTMSLRLLCLLAVLGSVGTYLFADVAIGLIYSLEKFAPAADTLRAFAPVLLLMYVDVFLSLAILALGKARLLAVSKVGSVVLTSGLVFVLVPLCQARFANGGLGVMYAMVVGELVMLVVSLLLMRRSVDRRMLGDVSKALAAGLATVLVVRWLPSLSPFLAIPLCIALFGVMALLVRAVRVSELRELRGSFRRTSPAV